MEKSEQSNRVSQIRSYLQAIGHPVSQVQALEVLARALGMKNKHVLAAFTQPGNKEDSADAPAANVSEVADFVLINKERVAVMKLTDDAFGVQQMEAMDWSFDVVIPFALDQLTNIDEMNDYASTRITGNAFALVVIGFNHCPSVNYGFGWVAYRVTGSISSPESVFEEVADEHSADFYKGLAQLADILRERSARNGEARFTVIEDGRPRPLWIHSVDLDMLGLLTQYAASQGGNNDAVNECKERTLFSVRAEGTSADFRFELGSAKYSVREYAAPGSATGPRFELLFEGRRVVVDFGPASPLATAD